MSNVGKAAARVLPTRPRVLQELKLTCLTVMC